MDFLSSLSMLLSLSPPPFFSILQSPEASISLITESLHLNSRLCIVRTKGRAASEEVLDRGMDWAQRLGWVELQVQASLPEQRKLKEGLHSNFCGTFRDWEDLCAAAALQCNLLLNLNCKGEHQEFYSGLIDPLYCSGLRLFLCPDGANVKPGLGLGSLISVSLKQKVGKPYVKTPNPA